MREERAPVAVPVALLTSGILTSLDVTSAEIVLLYHLLRLLLVVVVVFHLLQKSILKLGIP